MPPPVLRPFMAAPLPLEMPRTAWFPDDELLTWARMGLPVPRHTSCRAVPEPLVWTVVVWEPTSLVPEVMTWRQVPGVPATVHSQCTPLASTKTSPLAWVPVVGAPALPAGTSRSCASPP